MTITYHIFNSIDSKKVMSITVPWDYQKAVKGFYSNLWRDFKVSCASSVKLDKRHLKAKIVRQRNINTNRFEICFPGGIKFNSPFDLNKVDFKIINLHLEALYLSRGMTKCP